VYMCSVEEEEEDGEVWGLTRIECRSWGGGEEEESFLFKEAEEEGQQEE
jgi:hypothetical protein